MRLITNSETKFQKYAHLEKFQNMKIKAKSKTEKTTIQELREIRDRISIEIQDMTAKQLKEYFSKQKTLHSSKEWQNAS